LRNPVLQRHRAILSPLNDEALDINERVLQLMDGDSCEYRSLDEVCNQEAHDAQNFPLEFLHTLTPSGMPPHRLHLKVGAVVMLLRNLRVRRRLCNGSPSNACAFA